MAAAKRDVGRERHWRRLLGQWRRSGVSVREFCQAVEVGESAFYFWRRELLRVRPPIHVVRVAGLLGG